MDDVPCSYSGKVVGDGGCSICACEHCCKDFEEFTGGRCSIFFRNPCKIAEGVKGCETRAIGLNSTGSPGLVEHVLEVFYHLLGEGKGVVVFV